jgi:ligand-binding sensor domain-containing protein
LPARADDLVSGIVEDRRGRVWIGTLFSGLFVLEDERLTAFEVGEDLIEQRIVPRITDREGNLWLSSDKRVFIISGMGDIIRLTDEQNLLNGTTEFFEDREDNIWIGTLRRGINRLSRQSIRFYGTKDGLAADVVHPIYQTRDGDIWLGGQSLTRFRNGKFSAAKRENFAGEMTAIEEDKSGRLWFGHWSGAYYIENGVTTLFD